jgi:hypothetical protein
LTIDPLVFLVTLLGVLVESAVVGNGDDGRASVRTTRGLYVNFADEGIPVEP